MRAVLSLCLIVLALLAVRPAHAAEFSGNYLLAMCASDASGKELVPGGHIACQSYISGVLDYHNVLHSLGTAPGIDFCLPEAVSLNDLETIVTRYLRKNRNIHGSFVAAPAVALALYNAYPCHRRR